MDYRDISTDFTEDVRPRLLAPKLEEFEEVRKPATRTGSIRSICGFLERHSF